MTLSRIRDGYLRREKSASTTGNGTGVQDDFSLSGSLYDDWCIHDAVKTGGGSLKSLYTEPEIPGWVVLTQWIVEKLTNAAGSM
jgi:hypothetical protein